MEAEAYKEWINLYTEEVEEVWNSQKDELRKATTILFVLQREFKRIQNDLEKQHIQFRIEYDAIKRDKLLIASPKAAANREVQTEPETLNESSDETICVSPKISRQKHFKRKKPKFSLLDDGFSKRPSLSLQEGNACDVKKGTSFFECNNQNGPCTPKLPSHTDDLIDCTMIDGTPNASKREKKGRLLTNCTRKKNKMKKSSNGTTLTQMFFTTCGSSTKENENSSIVSNDSKSTSTVLLENDCNVVDDTLHEKTDFRQPKPIICKEAVVRGKNRQKLQGWDCEECRKFYEGLDLNTQEFNAILNKCSKHRATRKPDDYTPPGYWTLAFTPTQKTVMAEKSPTDHSTFFQF